MPTPAGLYYEWHGPEDGESLILSSGLGGSANYWAPNLAALGRALSRPRSTIIAAPGAATARLPERVTVERHGATTCSR